MTGNRKKANARHEQVVDKRPCGLCGYRDNRRGDCGEQVCKDDEDEITFLPLWRPVPLWRLFFFNVSRTKYALFAAAVYFQYLLCRSHCDEHMEYRHGYL